MLKNITIFLHEPKIKIGWVHGLFACIGGAYLSFFSMMSMSYILDADYAIKLLPTMISTPILLCFFGLWLLYSQTIFDCLKKIFYGTLGIVVLLLVSQWL